ncbi:E2/UBC family protein [Mycobacterium sherrisii]|uniref:E2/UBC family protein n=1 Tax=Mycobacterium sherrisii TaxID=243061 RepID=UPI003976EE21
MSTNTVLREQDREFLDSTGLVHAITVDGGFANVVLDNFSTAAGLSPAAVDLLLRLPFGFPDAAPDMFWLAPNVTKDDGGQIPGTEVTETWVNRPWQRWSRHIAQQWRPGVDNLETYLAYVRRCLRQAAGT